MDDIKSFLAAKKKCVCVCVCVCPQNHFTT